MSPRRADDAASRSLTDPLTVLPGAGPVTAARLSERGLRTVADILSFLPRGYDDLRTVTPIAALAGVEPGRAVVVRGRVARVRMIPHRFLDVTLDDGSGSELHALWFRVPGGMARQYERGAEVALAGPLRRSERGTFELAHPANVTARLAAAGGIGLGIRPRYPLIDGVPGSVLERMIAAAVERYAALLPDLMPSGSRARLELPSVSEAVRQLQRPVELPAAELDALVAGRSPAHRRIALDDLLVVQVGLRARREAMRAEPARTCGGDSAATLQRLRAALPFQLTKAQERAVSEIAADLQTPHPMQRMLVGDVGSGKTAVALAAACLVAASGGQTLLMAPTEVLAEQHMRTLSALAAPLGLRVGLLTASVKGPMRVSLLALVAAGSIHILVGTHALLDESVALDDVALAIVDEQHRFGVAQRARLAARGASTGAVPHLLVMTATPIPRSMALALYGDLDLSVLDELPPGRALAPASVHVGPRRRDEALDVLRTEIAAGRQAYVVCPVLSESTREDAVTAVARHAELQKLLAPARVGLLHGQLDARAKETVLRAFRDRQLDVLVATTVIEVGIDVANATVMLVEESDRFGLAQLHQLRGRVGRGQHPGRCLLCTNVEAGEALERLKMIESTRDGFRIAEADMHMRGHGELYGVRQAGLPQLRYADLSGYPALLEQARAEAERIAREDPKLDLPEHAPLKAEIARRWEQAQIFGEEAG